MAINNPESAEIKKMRVALLHLRFGQQVRTLNRQSVGGAPGVNETQRA
jgi:hypothetical protein